MALAALLGQAKTLDIDAGPIKNPSDRSKHESAINQWRDRCVKELATTQANAACKSVEPLTNAWRRLHNQPGMLISASEFSQWLEDVSKFSGTGADSASSLEEVRRFFYATWHGNESASRILLASIAPGAEKLPLLGRLLDHERHHFKGLPLIIGDAVGEQEAALDGNADPSMAELSANDVEVRKLYHLALRTTHFGWHESREAYDEWEAEVAGENAPEADTRLCTAPEGQDDFSAFEKNIQVLQETAESARPDDTDASAKEKDDQPTTTTWTSTWKDYIAMSLNFDQQQAEKKNSKSKGKVEMGNYNGFDRTVLICRRCLTETASVLGSSPPPPAGLQADLLSAQRVALYTLIDLVGAPGNVLHEFLEGEVLETDTPPPLIPTVVELQEGLWRQLLHYTASIRGLALDLIWALLGHIKPGASAKIERCVFSVMGFMFAPAKPSMFASEEAPLLPMRHLAQLVQALKEAALHVTVTSAWPGSATVKSVKSQLERIVEVVKSGSPSELNDSSFSAGLFAHTLLGLFTLDSSLHKAKYPQDAEKFFRFQILHVISSAATVGDVELLRSLCYDFVSNPTYCLEESAASLRTLVAKRVSGQHRQINKAASRQQQQAESEVGSKRPRTDDPRHQSATSDNRRERTAEEPPVVKRRTEGGDAAGAEKKPLRDNDELSVCIPGMLLENAESRVKDFFASCPGGIAVVDIQGNKKDATKCFAFVQMGTGEGLQAALALSGTEMVQGGAKTQTRKVRVSKYEPKNSGPRETGDEGRGGAVGRGRGGAGRGGGRGGDFQEHLLSLHGKKDPSGSAPKGKGFFDNLLAKK